MKKEECALIIVIKEVNRHNVRTTELLRCNRSKVCLKLRSLVSSIQSEAKRLTEIISSTNTLVIDRENYNALVMDDKCEEYKLIKNQDGCYNLLDAVYENYDKKINLVSTSDVLCIKDAMCEKAVQKELKKKAEGIKVFNVAEDGKIEYVRESSIEELTSMKSVVMIAKLIKKCVAMVVKKCEDGQALITLVDNEMVYTAIKVKYENFEKVAEIMS